MLNLKPKNLIKIIFVLAISVGAICYTSFNNGGIFGARTDNFWSSYSTYIKTNLPTGYNILINGVNKYLNFGSVSGESGYGFRDNAGSIQYKDSGGAWAGFSAGSMTALPDTQIFVGNASNEATATSSVTVNSAGTLSASGGTSLEWTTAYGWGDHAGLYDVLGQATSTLASHTSTYNHANYDTAYGWGNHSSAGYLTSYTESDPIWLASSSDYLLLTTASTLYDVLGQATSTLAKHTNAYDHTSFIGFTDIGENIEGLSYSFGNFSLTSGYVIASTTRLALHDTAYSWGDHSGAGYLNTSDIDSFSELDAVVTDASLLISGGTLTSGYQCRYDGTGIDCDRAEDSSGDCSENSVCLGGHTHSEYLPMTASSSLPSDNLWSLHNSYPAACDAGEYVTAIGDTLTCATPAGSGTVNASKIRYAAYYSASSATISGTSSLYFGTNYLQMNDALIAKENIIGEKGFQDADYDIGTPGQLLSSTGAVTNWVSTSTLGLGTVSSVALSVPTGLSISGTPITSAGTLALTVTGGYEIVKTASSTNWETAYGWGDHSSGGYLTSYTETDPIWLASSSDYLLTSVANITFDALGQATSTLTSHTSTYNHANYDTAYWWGNHADAGYYTFATTSLDYWWNNTSGVTPSSQITAGTNLSWDGSTLNSSATSYSTLAEINAAISPEVIASTTSSNAGFINDAGYLTSVASDSTWTTHNSYPSACASNEVVQGIGDTLTCIATSTIDTKLNLGGAETITGNWVNTTNPWADNEVSDTLTCSVVSDADKGDITISSGVWAVEDDSHAHVYSNIDAFTEANLYTLLSDVTQFYESGDKVGDADTLDTHDTSYFQIDLTDEASLYSALSDVSQFYEPGDDISVGDATSTGEMYITNGTHGVKIIPGTSTTTFSFF